MIYEFLVMAGFAFAVIGLALSIWSIVDELKGRKGK